MATAALARSGASRKWLQGIQKSVPNQPGKPDRASRKCAGAPAVAGAASLSIFLPAFLSTLLLAGLFVLPVAAQTEPPKSAGSPMHPEQRETVPPGAAADPGAIVFAQHCAVCHGEHGEGVSAQTSIAGPNLQAEHGLGQVLAAVEVGPSHMPSFARVLPVESMRQVAQYVTRSLATIPLTGGNLGEGGELFREYCAACHRTAVRGGALAFVGTNAPDLSEKSSALVAGAIRWGPGPMPAFPQSVLSDRQVDSIVQYVGNVQHPSNPGGWAMHWFGPTAEGLAAWVVVFVVGGFTMWIERGGKG
jgi:ubiquinol-cytochrome c reductase cytochrome c subunit